jgi:hypothetical protein
MRVKLWTLRRQRDDCNVGRHHEVGGKVPPGLINQQNGVAAGRDLGGDCRQVQGHRLGVAPRQDQAAALAPLGADRTEDVGRGGSLVLGRGRPSATSRPASGDLVLLANTGFM